MAKCIVQISDFHLPDNPQECHEGISAYNNFVGILEYIRKHYYNCDYIIITGDLAHTASKCAYLQIRELLGDFLPRCRLIPGNHDCRDNLRQVFQKVIPDSSGPINFAMSVGNWRLVGLDSLIQGDVGGRIGDDQLQWLENELYTNKTKNFMLFVHHPPIVMGSPWLDGIGLYDRSKLIPIINESSQVKVIFAGHAHQEYEGLIRNVPVRVIPSTSLQFTPKTNSPTYDDLPPGFRVIELNETTFSDKIIRLENLLQRINP